MKKPRGNDGLKKDGFYLDKEDDAKVEEVSIYRNKYHAKLVPLTKPQHPDMLNGIYHPTTRSAFHKTKKPTYKTKWSRPLSAAKRSRPKTATKQDPLLLRTNVYVSNTDTVPNRITGPFENTYIHGNSKSRLPIAPAWKPPSDRLPEYKAKTYNNSTNRNSRVWAPLSTAGIDHTVSTGCL